MADPRCATLRVVADELRVVAEATGLVHQLMLADWMDHEARQAVYGWGMASDYAHRYAVAWRARRLEDPEHAMVDAALAQIRAQLLEAVAGGVEIVGLNVDVVARGAVVPEDVVLDVVASETYAAGMTEENPETTEVSVETPAKNETTVEVTPTDDTVQHAEGEVQLDGSGNAPDPAQADAAAQEGDSE